MSDKYLADFGKKLKTVRQLRKFTQEELAAKADLDRTYISMLERGVRNPTLAVIWPLALALGTTPWELLEGKFQGKKDKLLSPPDRGVKWPLYGTSVSCGRPLGGSDSPTARSLSLEDYIIKKPENTFFVKASGDSMQPTIGDGDLLAIEENVRPKAEDIILASLDGDYSVKRVRYQGQDLILGSDNPFYGDLNPADYQQLTVCGVVRAIIRTKF